MVEFTSEVILKLRLQVVAISQKFLLRYCLNSATKFDATMFSPKGKTLLRRYFVAELYIRSTFVTRRLQVDFHYCDTMRTLLQQTSLTPNFCCNNFFHCCNKIFFLKIEFSRLLQQCHCCDKIRFLIFNIGNSKN